MEHTSGSVISIRQFVHKPQSNNYFIITIILKMNFKCICPIFLTANIVQLHFHFKKKIKRNKGQRSWAYISFVQLIGQKIVYNNVD